MVSVPNVEDPLLVAVVTVEDNRDALEESFERVVLDLVARERLDVRDD